MIVCARWRRARYAQCHGPRLKRGCGLVSPAVDSVVWELEILPRAEAEMAQAEDWYGSTAGGTGTSILAEVEAVLERIADGPERFPRWLDDRRYRRAVLHRFPYVVIFIALHPTPRVTVVAIAHTSREPGYWR